MAVTVINTSILDFNANVKKNVNVATVDTVDGTEVFTITPTYADCKTVVEVYAGNDGALTVDVAVGEQWSGEGALQVVIPSGETHVIQLEGGRFASNDGEFALTLTPATGKKLLTVGASVAVVQSK